MKKVAVKLGPNGWMQKVQLDLSNPDYIQVGRW